MESEDCSAEDFGNRQVPDDLVAHLDAAENKQSFVVSVATWWEMRARMPSGRSNGRRLNAQALSGRKVRTPQGSVPRNAGGSWSFSMGTESATEKIPPRKG